VRRINMVRLMFVLALATLLATTANAAAQTGTNMINLISDNATFAQATLAPIGIGLTVLFIAIAIGVKVFKKTVKG